MLSEGWDAKNVTHIMGLRAFTSPAPVRAGDRPRPCAASRYDKDENGLFVPEYVNVFGVPLSISEDVGEGGEAPPPPKPSTQIESLAERGSLEIRWPNVLRIETVVRPAAGGRLEQGRDAARSIRRNADYRRSCACLGRRDRLEQGPRDRPGEAARDFRLQRLTFQAARKAFARLRQQLQGQRGVSGLPAHPAGRNSWLDRLEIPSLFHQDPLRKRILIALNIDLVVQHLLRFVVEQNTTSARAGVRRGVPDRLDRRRCAPGTRPSRHPTLKSQISHVVGDSHGSSTPPILRDFAPRSRPTPRTTTSVFRSTTCGMDRDAASSPISLCS